MSELLAKNLYDCTVFVYNSRSFFDRSIRRPALDEVYQTLKIHHRISQDQVSRKLISHDAILSWCFLVFLKADLHGRTLSHTASLRQAYRMT